jgi:hypothetical protein
LFFEIDCRYDWKELATAEEDEEEGRESNSKSIDICNNSDCSVEFGIFATIWPLGTLRATDILESLTSSLYKANLINYWCC